MEDNSKMTRRQAVSGLGVTLAAAALSPISAAAGIAGPARGPVKLEGPHDEISSINAFQIPAAALAGTTK